MSKIVERWGSVMNEKQYYSADRNHYFFGKLMSVRDFENEQQYMNNRRRLGNRMLHGAGIVSGLNVLMLDNQTFSLETGMALDYLGREIVVSEPCVKRLSAIEGFNEQSGGEYYLCIRYREELREGTFSIAGSAAGSNLTQEYNCIHEDYELFLTRNAPKQYDLGLEGLLRQSVVIYDKNGIKLSLETVRYAAPDSTIPVIVRFEKSDLAAPVRYQFQLEGNLFEDADGGALTVKYDETEVKTFQELTEQYELYCKATTDICAALQVKQLQVSFGGEKDTLNEIQNIDIQLTTRGIAEVITESYYNCRFEEMLKVEDRHIYLAKFHVMVGPSTYFIEKMAKNPFKQYLINTELLHLLQGIPDGNTKNKTQVFSKALNEPHSTAKKQEAIVNVVTGVEKINLGFAPKAGKNYYSYEFVHGLGYGNVAVVAALENNEVFLSNDDQLLLFGNTEIFRSEEFPHSLPRAEVGAMVKPQKGTLQLGVHLYEKTELQTLSVRWWAMKPLDEYRQETEIPDDGIAVIVKPNTESIEPLAQLRFQAEVTGTVNQEVEWIVCDRAGGTIDRNGLYTAPSREGVYEIMAKSVKYEDKKASAYIVVRAQTSSEAED